MLNRDLRLFLGSFLLTLLLCGWLAVFLTVDEIRVQFGNSSAISALGMTQEDPLHYAFALLGQEYPVSLEPYNRFEQLRKEYACLVTPRPILAVEQLYSLTVYGWRYFNDWYKEEQYLQNVATSN